MYYDENDTPAMARTSNLNEELGQVNKILTYVHSGNSLLHSFSGEVVAEFAPPLWDCVFDSKRRLLNMTRTQSSCQRSANIRGFFLCFLLQE